MALKCMAVILVLVLVAVFVKGQGPPAPKKPKAANATPGYPMAGTGKLSKIRF